MDSCSFKQKKVRNKDMGKKLVSETYVMPSSDFMYPDVSKTFTQMSKHSSTKINHLILF